MRRLGVGIIVIGVVGAGIFYKMRSPSTSERQSLSVEASVTGGLEQNSLNHSGDTGSELEAEDPSLDSEPPSYNGAYNAGAAPSYEGQVAGTGSPMGQDPAFNSSSLMDFAEELAPEVEAALESEPAAEALFQEFEETLLESGASAPKAVQAVYLSNARILKERYSNLGSRYDALLQQADPEVVKLMQ
jgi:hypothetical protein